MTRINSAIKPAELCDQHLVAEYRELPRISTLAWARSVSTNKKTPAPTEFTLGRGHMAFFVDKGGFCATRFALLVAEMEARGFKPQFRTYRPHPEGMNLDHEPTKAEFDALVARISLRMPKNPRFTTSKSPSAARLSGQNDVF